LQKLSQDVRREDLQCVLVEGFGSGWFQHLHDHCPIEYSAACGWSFRPGLTDVLYTRKKITLGTLADTTGI